MIRIGLRFRYADARKLRQLADRVRSGELPSQHAKIFDDAATSAATGEPLIVHCTDAAEAQVLADGYTLYGITRPTLDELTGYVSAN